MAPRRRGADIDGYPVCSLDDIIASKRTANRSKDRDTLPRLEAFRRYQRDRGTTRRRLPALERSVVPTSETHELTLILAHGENAEGPPGPVPGDIEAMHRAHPDAIPATMVTGRERMVFGLATEDGEVTVLYRITPGTQREFARWMRDKEPLWDTPFHDAAEGDEGLAAYVNRQLARSRSTGEPGNRE